MQTDARLIARARKALGISTFEEEHVELKIVLEEISDLKQVWTQLGLVWKSLLELKETHWASLTSLRLKSNLDQITSDLSSIPTFIQQYAGFSYLSYYLKDLQKTNNLLVELKSDILRDRHWSQLFSLLEIKGAQKNIQQLTLGQFWDSKILLNDFKIRQVLNVARGEAVLEDFLRTVKETWTSYELEFVVYQGKCRLIKGWDDLLVKCKEHLSSLTSMSSSIYYPIFEEEASALEKKLNQVHLVFDSWIDIQRQWIYLEGIFSGNNEIESILPVETSRFKSVNVEFMQLMGKVYRLSKVLDVVAITDLHSSLKRFAALFDVLQKALGDYLELQRNSFPRFYFVGDDDLLDIIGNSKDIRQLQKHFKKLFCGIASVILSDDGSAIVAIESFEGEILHLLEPTVMSGVSVVSWLHSLENGIKHAFAEILAKSIPVAEKLDVKKDDSSYRDWIQGYPSQVLNLTLQVVWTRLMEKNMEQADSVIATVQEWSQSQLDFLASYVLSDLPMLVRKKAESMIIELVHQRDVAKKMIQNAINSPTDFSWLSYLRFYYDASCGDPLARLKARIANTEFCYGYEYLGAFDRLVQTSLTNRCYLTLTQALHYRLGGSPSGPAGTGKTETVKALGASLGQLVLVFCCDENFDVKSLGRILIGMCKVGAWACFDEFNRLDERTMSSVSQQIQQVQNGLKTSEKIRLMDKDLVVQNTTGTYIDET